MGRVSRGCCLALIAAVFPLGAAADPVRPDPSLTPGVVDANVTDGNVCAHDWTYGGRGSAPVEGGTLTYSKAARHTPEKAKAQSFAAYGLSDPRDGGESYEVDHRVPLSLGGRDDPRNLWPESRDRSLRWNARMKDRLEFKIYNLVCRPAAGQPPMSVRQAQAIFLGDWVVGYLRYCPTEADCPPS